MKRMESISEMNDRIKNLVDEIFEDGLYSKTTVEAKEKIAIAFKEKYEQLKEKYNDIEALGVLMSQYGTMLKAGKLAGYTEQEIKGWKDDCALSAETFAQSFRKVRRWLYFLAFFSASALVQLFNLFLYHTVINIVGFAVSVIIWLLFGRFVWTKRKSLSFDRLSFDKSAKLYIELYTDKYTKRLINSIFLAIGTAVFIIFPIINTFVYDGVSNSELLTSILVATNELFLVAYLLFKNILCRYWLSFDLPNRYNNRVKEYIKKLFAASGIYWLVFAIVLYFLRNILVYHYNAFMLSLIIYGGFAVVSNFTVREKIVFKNITFNLHRVVVVSLCVLLVLTYQVMKMDTFLLQPYISTVDYAGNRMDKIEYDDESGVYTITTDKKDFKILQLTDIHIGGSPVSVIKDYKALQACNTLIDAVKPDLVLVTGDLVFPVGVGSYSFNNIAPIIEFSSFMRNKGVPWAFTYGNHDTEVFAKGTVEEVKNTFKSLSYKTSGNLLYPYVQPNITGRNNQLIEIRNNDGSLNQAIFLIDSNDYDETHSDYGYIHDDQVNWYKENIERLNEQENRLVSSLLFFHIPLQEYEKAFKMYERGSSNVTYFFGENKESGTGEVCCSNYPCSLFETAKKLGSTKAMFCGHDHYNNISLEYDGIRLTYGMSIDYLAMPGIDSQSEQRGGTVITCHTDSTIDIEQIKLTDVND